MSAFILQDKTINSIASTLVHYAEYGQYHTARTNDECRKLILDLEIEDSGVSSSMGVIFINEKQADSAAAKIANSIYRMNVEAVNCRYQENEPVEYSGFKTSLPLQTIQAYKFIQCFLYQCSEGNVPEQDLFKRVTAISDALAHDIVNNSKEYDAASWG